MIKKEKGITLVSLVITIVLMLIIASSTIYVSLNRFEINNFSKMKNDIILLDEKVSNYYLKYAGLPILRESDGLGKKYTYTSLDFEKNSGDNENYYIIDLEAMEGLSLNYGEEGFKNPNTSDDIYIINEETHTIYYVRGIKLNGELYYYLNNETNIVDNIPPTKPQIKVVSGSKNNAGKYITEIELKFVPGKIEGEIDAKTEFSIDSGKTWENIATLENNIYKITEDGAYNVIVKSYDKAGNVSENEISVNTTILKIGDKVAYDEGADKISTVDPNFVMRDLEWRILDIEEDGSIKLISTQPTEDTYSIPKTEEGWLNGEENIDKLCDDLYGKGIGAINARSLKVEDINNLNVNFDPTMYNGRYGKKYYYRWNSVSGKIQYSEDYNEETEVGNWKDTAYTSFKEPGVNMIDSNNYLNTNGKVRIAKLQHTYLYYTLEEVMSDTLKTRDGIYIYQLISQGLNNTNTEASGIGQKQWLSSKYIDCSLDYVEFGMLRIADNGAVSDREFYRSYGEEVLGEYYYVVRPVVLLNSDINIEFIDEEWKISE